MHRILLLPALCFSAALAAQTSCDSITLESVRYDPFGNGFQVRLYNGSQQVLSGPTVDVLDANGTALALGIQEFFAVIPGSSNVHQVPFTPVPPTPFTGTIRLNYSDWDGVVTCSWPITDLNLCPSDPCMPLGVFAYQQGGDPVPMDMDWEVTDATNTSQASGLLQMDGTGFGYAVAELCLPPGAYTLHMAQPVAAGTLIQVGLTQDDFAWTNGLNTQLPPGGTIALPFGFYAPCALGAQGLTPLSTHAPKLYPNPTTGQVTITFATDGAHMVLLCDAQGRLVRSEPMSGTTTTLDLRALPAGLYIVREVGAAQGVRVVRE